jgi:hypothetical protein
MRHADKPLDTLEYKPMSGYSPSQNRVVTEENMRAADLQAWLIFGNAQWDAVREARPGRSAFDTELAAWEAALPRIAALPQADRIKDSTMSAMLRFYHGGQLKPALFLIAYRESYRRDFEAWKKANPDGIRRFVETFRVSI